MPKADKGKPELSALVVGNTDDMEQTANALEEEPEDDEEEYDDEDYEEEESEY